MSRARAAAQTVMSDQRYAEVNRVMPTASVSQRSPALPQAPKTVQLFALLLEMGILAALAYWGWSLFDGGIGGVILAVSIPALAVLTWVVLAAPGLSGRQTQPLVKTPGWLRLALEIALIALAAYGAWTAGSRAAGETLLTAAGLLLAVSVESVRWLIRH